MEPDNAQPQPSAPNCKAALPLFPLKMIPGGTEYPLGPDHIPLLGTAEINPVLAGTGALSPNDDLKKVLSNQRSKGAGNIQCFSKACCYIKKEPDFLSPQLWMQHFHHLCFNIKLSLFNKQKTHLQMSAGRVLWIFLSPLAAYLCNPCWALFCR